MIAVLRVLAAVAPAAVAVGLAGCSSEDTAGSATPALPPVACPDGFADCDRDPVNGCEAALETSVAQCGACDRACAPGPNAAAVCSAGACVQVCVLGFGDCDGVDDNGCETSLMATVEHCGACGNACVASCEAGACDIEVLAPDQAGASFLADDGEWLVWVDRGSEDAADGSVQRIAKTGGPPTIIAEGQRRPTGLALLGDDVVWAVYGTDDTADGAILRAPKSGAGPVVVVVGGIRAPVNVQIDGDRIYWASFGSGFTSSDGGVYRRSIEPGDEPVEEVAKGQPLPFGLAVDATHVYWTSFGLDASTGSVRRLPKDAPAGTPPEEIASGLDGTSHLLRAASGVLFAYEGAVASIDPASGEEQALLSGSMRPFRLWLTGDELHWTTLAPGGPIESASMTGGPSASRSTGSRFPYDLVVDATHVYWTSLATTDGGPGALLRMPR